MESKQIGAILLLRSAAYLQQAQFHKDALSKTVLDEWKQPSSTDLEAIIISMGIGSTSSSIVNGNAKSSSTTKTVDTVTDDIIAHAATAAAVRLALLKKLAENSTVQKRQLRTIQYLHGLYQNSLLQAVQDALQATEILPEYSTAWLRAAQLLRDLWKVTESRQYYEKAASLDDILLTDDDDDSDTANIDGTVDDALQLILKDIDQQEALLNWARGMDGWADDAVRLALDVSG
jgi:tetratricopeptide (TPR) repeat protein